MQSRPKGGTLKTTRLSLEMLDHVVEHEGATLDDLVDETGLAKSTVHNHVSTLLKHGYVTREDGTYYPGLKLYHFGDFARKRNDFYRVAKTIVPELAEETNLEADFTVEENGRIVSLYEKSSYADTPSYLLDGRLFHVHCTASGKAILAEFPEQRVRNILDRWGLPAVTEETITDVEAFLDELDEVRRRGYAINMSEAIEGMWAVSRAIKTPQGSVAGSLNVCGPTYLYADDRERSVVNTLTQKVRDFEQRIIERRESGDGE